MSKSIQELLKGATELKDIASFNAFLNQTPPQVWLKPNPLASGQMYQPIERVKSSLFTIFGTYDWEIIEVKQMLNSVVVVGKLTVTHPITNKSWSNCGTGAWTIQQSKGATPMDWTTIVNNALQKNVPAANSMAFKNAAAQFGNIFGDGQKELEIVSLFGEDDDEANDIVVEAPQPKVKQTQQTNTVITNATKVANPFGDD